MTSINSTPIDKEPVAVKVKQKPIEFVRFIDNCKKLPLDGIASLTKCMPEDWENLRLLIKGVDYEFDVIAAWDDDDRNSPCIYFGHWNDGVV